LTVENWRARRLIVAIVLALVTALAGLYGVKPAVALIVGTPYQAEDMSFSASGMSIDNEAGDFGSHLRFANGSGTNAVANEVVNPNQTVNEIRVHSRQVSGGSSVMAVYVGSTANKVGTFTPNDGSQWTTISVPLASPLSAGQPTILIGPNARTNAVVKVDYFELHNNGTPPPTDPQCSDGVDNDGDSRIDYQDDPGCTSASDDNETDSVSGGGTCTGTTVSPTNNLENVIDNPGNYCLRAGVYQESDKQITINADNVTVRNVPGQRVEIRGRVRTNDGSANVRFIGSDVSSDFEGIKLDNSYAPLDWSTSGGMGHFTAVPHLIRGSGTVFENVEITSSNDALPDPWYNSQPSTPARASGTCILVADGTDGRQAADFRLAYSDVHNCGNKPNDQFGDIGQHAVYLSGALRAEIAHNMIYGGATRGVQQRSNTDNGHIYGNIIHENYVGVGHDEPSTSGNITENNVVTLNENKNIRNLSDAGPNTVRNNCGFGEPIPNGQNGNVTYSNNVNVSTNPYGREPSPSNDAVVSNSTCNAKLPAGSPFLP
jgi:hypothetical protein